MKHTYVSYSNFEKCGRSKRARKLNIFLLIRISQTAIGISFKFKVWRPLYREQLHCKFGAIWQRYHGATYAWKLQFCFSCQYAHSFEYAPFFWATRHTIMCIDQWKWIDSYNRLCLCTLYVYHITAFLCSSIRGAAILPVQNINNGFLL